MPIDQKNTKLLAVVNDVDKARAFTESGATKQLRRLPGHSDEEYELYQSLAYKIEAVPLTVAAFVGMIMEPAPSVPGIDEAHKEITEDLTAEGEPLNRCIARTLDEVIKTGRHIALAEYPVADGPVTRARAREMGLRPFAAFYNFEDLIDWKTEKRGANKVLTELRLYEEYTEDLDRWTKTTHRQIRVLFLDEDGLYAQQVYRKDDAVKAAEQTVQKIGAPAKPVDPKADNTNWKPVYVDDSGQEAPIYPRKGGAPMREIPVVFFGPDSLDLERIIKPPITPLVNIAVSHLNNSALREWALMWCGAATLVISGEVPVDADGKPLPIRVGSAEAIVLGEGGEAALLQAGKDSVGAIAETMDKKEDHMAAAGARMLTESGSSNISTETALLERVGQFSTVASIANTTAEGYLKLLTHLFEWKSLPIPADLEVRLNTDYVPQGLKPGEIADWLKGVQGGTIPLSSFINFMRKRGAISAEMTDEDYRNELEADGDEFKTGAPPPPGAEIPPTNDDDEDEDEE